jgi:hypothetical protein
VLTVTSGGTSASIDLSGHYTSASFHVTSGDGGSAEICDPPVIAQQSTLGFTDTIGGIEEAIQTVVSDILAGKFALLCNFIASEFASVVDGHGAAALNEASRTADQQSQPLLTRPHA